MLVGDSAAAVVCDLGAALTERTCRAGGSGDTLTVIVSDADEAALAASGRVSGAFAAHDAQVTDERYNLLNAWLAALPRQYRLTTMRSMHLLNTNAADLAAPLRDSPGRRRGMPICSARRSPWSIRRSTRQSLQPPRRRRTTRWSSAGNGGRNRFFELPRRASPAGHTRRAR